MKKRLLCLVFLCLWFPNGPLLAQAPAKTCGQLFKQGQAQLAGDCFAQLADRMPPNQQLDDLQKRQKGFYLQNAAKAYAIYAKQVKQAPEQSFYNEKASLLLHRYLNEKLCSKDYQCRSTRGLLYEYEQRIGYATLALFDESGTSPSVELRGYKYESRFTFQKKHTVKLRPGTYKMKVTYANSSMLQRSFTLGKGEDRPERLRLIARTPRPPQTPPTQTKAPLGAWIVLGGGLAILATGGALLGISLAMDGSIGTKLNEANVDVAKSREIGSDYETAQSLNLGGWVALSAGAAITVGGVLWLVLSPKKALPQTASLSKGSETSQTCVPLLKLSI